MTIQTPKLSPDLSRLFAPAAIALVGASSNPKLTSGQPLHFLKEYGYAGRFFAVNPKRNEVQGIKTYASVLELPEICDVAVITVAAPLVAGVIRECGTAGIPFAIILTAGFERSEGDGASLQLALQSAITESGVRVVGPNCTGIINLFNHAFCGQGGALSDPNLRAGPVAVVSQSGGVGLSMLAFINSTETGVGYLASSGNEADLDICDLANHLLEKPDVEMIALYLETSIKGRKIRALGNKALQLQKPIVVLKAGNNGLARNAATSHTGRLTADYALFRTAFQEGGFVEVSDIDEMVETINALKSRSRPLGNRVAIQTTSGGWGVMLAERCEQLGLILPPLSEHTIDAIKPLVPGYASLGNPLDITPQGYKDQYSSYNEITRHLLAAPENDLLVVRSATGGDMAVWAEGLIGISKNFDKPVFVHWATSPNRYPEVKALLEQSGIPCFSFVNQIARNVAACIGFAAKIQRVPVAPSIAAVRNWPTGIEIPPAGCILRESEATQYLRAYGIATVAALHIAVDDINVAELSGLRLPVAVKVSSADIPHKTDIGGVALNIESDVALRAAAQAIIERARTAMPEAVIDGVLIQEMTTGIEMIVGAINDRHFGAIVMLGMGGALAEVIDDVSYRFAPVTSADAMDMIDELKAVRILNGQRGQSKKDTEALADAIVKISTLITDWPEQFSEIEINPLFVHSAGKGVTAADCLIITKSRTDD